MFSLAYFPFAWYVNTLQKATKLLIMTLQKKKRKNVWAAVSRHFTLWRFMPPWTTFHFLLCPTFALLQNVPFLDLNCTFFGSINFIVHFTVWKYMKFSLTEIFFREISSLVTSLVKTLLSRNFCQKSVRVNFRNFHTVYMCVESTEIYSYTYIFSKNFVKITIYY